MKKKAIILGGGISGLSLRYYLHQQHPDWEVILVEKTCRLGGMIASRKKEGFFFEQGPRIFKASKSHHLLKLILALDMSKDILVSRKEASRRFLWVNNHLHALPRSLLAFLTSSLTRPLISSLIREWRQPKEDNDETIYHFAKRRFGEYAAEIFFDPMTLGIYAGDIRKLSITSCFPLLKELEQSHCSITKGFLKRGKSIFAYPKGMKPSHLFTLRDGIESLVDKIQEVGKGEIYLETPVEEVQLGKRKALVKSKMHNWEADYLFCTLPPNATHLLTKNLDKKIGHFYHNLNMVDLSVVSLSYKGKLLNREGFGYLVPSKEREKILGVIFDSSIFPQQNQLALETRLTVMMGGAHHPDLHLVSREEQIEEALIGVNKHLGISEKPIYTSIKEYAQAIPQFTVGHRERVAHLRRILKEKYPHFMVLGNYLDGVSISDCIAGAEKASKSLF